MTLLFTQNAIVTSAFIVTSNVYGRALRLLHAYLTQETSSSIITSWETSYRHESPIKRHWKK